MRMLKSGATFLGAGPRARPQAGLAGPSQARAGPGPAPASYYIYIYIYIYVYITYIPTPRPPRGRAPASSASPTSAPEPGTPRARPKLKLGRSCAFGRTAPLIRQLSFQCMGFAFLHKMISVSVSFFSSLSPSLSWSMSSSWCKTGLRFLRLSGFLFEPITLTSL